MRASSRPSTRRRSLRGRLTLVYGGLFLAAGLLLLVVTYLLFRQQLERSTEPVLVRGVRDGAEFRQGSPPPDGLDTVRWLEQQREELREAASTSLLFQGTIALLAVGVLAVALGWLVAGRMLSPLRRVTETALRIAAAPDADRGLHERIGLRRPNDEVKELADAFDTMVERLDRSFDGQRRFVANASHELRTPLTLQRALVELAMHRPSVSDDLERLGSDLLRLNDRHERLISGLLLLARSEQRITDRSLLDLADILRYVVSESETTASEAGLVLRATAEPAPTVGNALLLERVVRNLVENAIRHNVPDGWIRAGTRTTRDGLVELTVTNSGPMIPPHDVAALFEPFHRLDHDRPAVDRGAGLGLSIVRSLVRAHDGDVLAESLPSGGLHVRVTFSAATDDLPADAEDLPRRTDGGPPG